MSFLDPEADQMDSMLLPLHYSTASSGNQIWMQCFTASLLNQTPCYTSPLFPLFCFYIPSLSFSTPPTPIFSTADRKCEMNLMQRSVSPKGSWDFYCKDLIDWRRRGDSLLTQPSPLPLHSAFLFPFFHPQSENHKKVVLHFRDSSLAVKQL